jgi:hypothetical protein
VRVIALNVPGHHNPLPLEILVLIGLIAVVYFAAREYFYWRNGK